MFVITYTFAAVNSPSSYFTKTVIATVQSILSVITCLQNKTKNKLEKPGGISKYKEFQNVRASIFADILFNRFQTVLVFLFVFSVVEYLDTKRGRGDFGTN